MYLLSRLLPTISILLHLLFFYLQYIYIAINLFIVSGFSVIVERKPSCKKFTHIIFQDLQSLLFPFGPLLQLKFILMYVVWNSFNFFQVYFFSNCPSTIQLNKYLPSGLQYYFYQIQNFCIYIWVYFEASYFLFWSIYLPVSHSFHYRVFVCVCVLSCFQSMSDSFQAPLSRAFSMTRILE